MPRQPARLIGCPSTGGSCRPDTSLRARRFAIAPSSIRFILLTLRSGRFGWGALEPTARYSELTLDRRVFTDGFADPSLWTNQARLVDVGMNWYLNKFVKVYFDWEHAMFASPVFSRSGHSQTSSDLFWVRTQVYF